MFSGVPWSGMRKVFAMLGRMLRSWLSMFQPEVQEKVELVIHKVEAEASSAPRIKWNMHTSGSA
jgi:hypothetical protein